MAQNCPTIKLVPLPSRLDDWSGLGGPDGWAGPETRSPCGSTPTSSIVYVRSTMLWSTQETSPPVHPTDKGVPTMNYGRMDFNTLDTYCSWRVQSACLTQCSQECSWGNHLTHCTQRMQSIESHFFLHFAQFPPSVCLARARPYAHQGVMMWSVVQCVGDLFSLVESVYQFKPICGHPICTSVLIHGHSCY